MELFIFKGKNICAHIDDRTATEKVIVECNMKEVWERFEVYNKKVTATNSTALKSMIELESINEFSFSFNEPFKKNRNLHS